MNPMRWTRCRTLLLRVVLPVACALVSCSPAFAAGMPTPAASGIALFPAHGATDVNPDTPLRIAFAHAPRLGTRGTIRVVDTSDGARADTLDLGLPPGPRNARMRAPYDRLVYPAIPTAKAIAGPEPDGYQRRQIGGRGEARAYHFYPVLIDDHVATIQPHAPLAYGRTYRVEVDAEVFAGTVIPEQWTFSTKSTPPARDARTLVVASDGSGDFSSVQGAIDFVPDGAAPQDDARTTIFIRSGIYEEIVNLRDKANLSLVGEDRERTVIRYANNGVFNARPDGADAAEMLRRFPNRRAVFSATQVHGLHLANLTLQSMGDPPAQAEALLVLGEQVIVSHVTIDGSGDALQAGGTVYVGDSQVKGYGDNVLGAGAVFFKDCDMVSTFGPHVWVRNGEGRHGNVFVDCRFRGTAGVQTVFARAPTNGGVDYPHAEVVLLSARVEGIRPEGWGAVGPDTAGLRYWEFDTRDATTGAPADVSRRAPHSRQLTMAADARAIADYRRPEFVLGGWAPRMAPFFVTSPRVVVSSGLRVLEAKAAGLPAVRYQWLKDGVPIVGETGERLVPNRSERGVAYAVRVDNGVGSLTSAPVVVD